jgi:hypothetical protein
MDPEDESNLENETFEKANEQVIRILKSLVKDADQSEQVDRVKYVDIPVGKSLICDNF